MFLFGKNPLKKADAESDEVEFQADDDFIVVGELDADSDMTDADEEQEKEMTLAVENCCLTPDAQQMLVEAVGTTDLTVISQDNVALECHRCRLADVSDVFR